MTTNLRFVLFVFVVLAVVLSSDIAAAQHARWADYRAVELRLHNGAGYSLGSIPGVAVHNELIVGIVRAHTDYARYRYSHQEYWHQHRGWNVQIVPEFGITTMVTLEGGDGTVLGAHIPIGVRFRRSWHMVAVGGSLHALLGTLVVFVEERALHREVDARNDSARFSFGSRIGFQVDFFPERLLGVEVAYTINTDAVDTYVHSFTGLLFINFLAIHCERCGSVPWIFTG